MENTIDVRLCIGRISLPILSAVAIGWLSLDGQAFAEEITLKFWDNQQTESGLSQYQAEAVKRFEGENPGIKVEVTTIPYPSHRLRC
jgi:ABC-type glycerol-3-phosphate transport system substrate-binding protein